MGGIKRDCTKSGKCDVCGLPYPAGTDLARIARGSLQSKWVHWPCVKPYLEASGLGTAAVPDATPAPTPSPAAPTAPLLLTVAPALPLPHFALPSLAAADPTAAAFKPTSILSSQPVHVRPIASTDLSVLTDITFNTCRWSDDAM